MQARHRSPVGGYKSSSMGIGGVRARAEFRNYNSGRGPSKQQPDIFMEAGRLAAEYLVFKGLLPSNALLPNASLTSPVGKFQGFKTQDGDITNKFPDEHHSRNYVKGRRRNASFRNYSSGFTRELERSRSWDRARTYPNVDGQDRDDHQVSKDSNGPLPNSIPDKITPDIGNAGESMCGNSEPALAKETSPINTGNDLPSVGEPDSNAKSDDTDISKIDADQVNVANNSDVLEKNTSKEHELFSNGHNQTSKTANDLLSLCRFDNVTTRTRSSLANRDLNVFHDFVPEDEDAHDGSLLKEEGHPQEIPMDVFPGVISSHQSHDVKSLNSDKLKSPAMEDESCLTHAIKQLNETSSSSFQESTLMRDREKIEGLAGFESCSSIALGRGEKRELDVDDDRKGVTKRTRELASLASTFSDGFLYRSISMENRQTIEEPQTSHSEPVDISMIREGDVRLGSGFTERKLLPDSFKTFDLNLMETSDVNENHDLDSVHIFPVIVEGVKQEAPADIHLTMSSNSNITSKYTKSGFDRRDVEVIDLENDSEQEEKALNNPERRSEVIFTGTDGSSNNARNTNNIPNAQDGYGLMISELLGNDIPNCSSLPADMHSLHNDMGIHNGEGMLGDDDSIYMSLGEIPISFLTAWEQPAQEFGKPF